ncbi:hypothetical protein FX016_23180 [Cupriavidus gilardii]|nr:hypothetical protein FX016_23180 [Cupriavidus gilardii]
MSDQGKLPTSEISAPGRRGRRYLFVPFHDKDAAAKLGARFDWKKELWFVPAGVDDHQFARWFEPPQGLSQADIVAQFADACRDAGLEIDGLPVMDGEWHTTTVTTSSSTKAKKGGYRASLEGKPNGYIVNFDTGHSAPWFPRGLVLSEEDREKNRLAVEQNRLQRERETAADREAASERATDIWNRLKPASSEHPYLTRKQVDAFGLRIDGDRLVTALRDVEGRIRSIQWIDPKGGKLYVKGGQKTGNFHVLGDLTSGRTVLFGEGYATCASLHMGTKLPVVEVFDGGNLGPVLAQLAPLLPGRTLIVCGDDDVLTRDRVLRTLNKVANSEFAKPRLQLGGGIADDEVILDGVARQLRSNPSCSIRLDYELGPDAVQRIVGEFTNSETRQRVPIKIANVGREKALAAAREHGAIAVFPVFQSLRGSPTDFNDLHVREGLQAVRRQVGAAMLGKAISVSPQRTPGDVAREVLGGNAVVVEAKTDAQYVGTVVGNTPSHAVQSVGRQTAVAHDLGRLDKIPPVGRPARIQYEKGTGRVTEPQRAVDRNLGH